MGLLSSLKILFARFGMTMTVTDEDDVDVTRDKPLDDRVDVPFAGGDSDEVIRLPEHFINRPARW